MDPTLLSALIKSFGAADTPENSNRIREFYASDPQAAERRAYGVKGYSGESSGDRDAILNSMLDKVIAQTDAAPAPSRQGNYGPGRDVEEVPVAASAPQASAPQTAAPTKPAPSLKGAFADTPVNPLEDAPQRGGNDGSTWNWLLPLLIGGAAVGANAYGGAKSTPADRTNARIEEYNRNNPQLTGPSPNTPQLTAHPRTVAPAPYSTDLEIPKGGNVKGSPAVPVTQQSPQDIERMKAEVEAENRAAAALQEQMRARARSESNTADLVKAARRAVGRR